MLTFSLKMSLKKPKHVTQNCKFTKYLMKKVVLGYNLLYYLINRDTQRGCVALKL
jgi:hypothetical protein